MKLVFSEIKNGEIFEDDFQHLTEDNGTIEFKHMSGAGGIAVVYAPNGTGKSSFAKALTVTQTTEEISFSAQDEQGRTVTPESKPFHVIHDQISRNIIPGTETDYLIGRQIKHEYELRDRINLTFETAFQALANRYKTEFKVTKVGDYLLEQISRLTDETYLTGYRYLRSIVNKQTHGNDIDREEYIRFIRNAENRPALITLEDAKRQFIILDTSGRNSVTKRIIELDYTTIIQSNETVQIERHDDAIKILEKYGSLDSCVVCDNHNYDGEGLLSRKTENRKRIYDGLDRRTKELLDKVVKESALTNFDPFNIRQIVNSFISGGEATDLHRLQLELLQYVHVIGDEMVDALFQCFDETTLFGDYDEFVEITATNPELDSEELQYIEDVISQSIRKDITIERDEDSRNYKLKLDGKEFLGKDRANLELSSGEQNFISLAFELILARHSAEGYIVMDDPISSFDSVYKNKIAFCIVKFLEDKKQIILTHNIDLIRLLNVQLNGCFNLYILNNLENGRNGFIPVSESERNLVINLYELIKVFQNKDNVLVPKIRNRRQFLMSMIPFMRGYVHILLDPTDDYGKLSNIMHGYSNDHLDLIPIYTKLFGDVFDGTEDISTNDILNLDYRNINTLDKQSLPLLSGTLEQTLIYYHLRMKVEKTLVDSFNVRTDNDTTTGQIIQRAFPKQRDNDERNWKYRVFFNSRKTLLNEFNHFEGNMNIFQPAIDINPVALQNEISSIEVKLNEVIAYARELQA